jgi:hypothetical protein
MRQSAPVRAALARLGLRHNLKDRNAMQEVVGALHDWLGTHRGLQALVCARQIV